MQNKYTNTFTVLDSVTHVAPMADMWKPNPAFVF